MNLVFLQTDLMKYAIGLNIFVLLFIFVFVLANKKRLKDVFADWLDYPGHTIIGTKRRVLIVSLLFVVFCLLTLVFLQPVLVESYFKDRKEAVKIVFLLDVSPSSLAEDMEIDPSFGIERLKELSNRDIEQSNGMITVSRLTYAKTEIIKTVDHLKKQGHGDKVALVIFADIAFGVIPFFISDYASLFRTLSEIDDAYIWQGIAPGSNFGRAIYEGLKLLDEKDKSQQILIMLTDGEREEDKVEEAEEFYREAILYYQERREYPIYIFGIGDSSEKSPIPIYNSQGDFTGEYDVFKAGKKKGQIVLTSPDPEFLQEVERDLRAELTMADKNTSLKDELLKVLNEERSVVGKKKVDTVTPITNKILGVCAFLFFVILIII